MIKCLYLSHHINGPSFHRRAVISRFILSHFSPWAPCVGVGKSRLTDIGYLWFVNEFSVCHILPILVSHGSFEAESVSSVHILQKTGRGWCVREVSPPPPPRPSICNTHTHTCWRKSPITWASPCSRLIPILIRATFENEIKCLVHCESPAPHCLWYHTVACEQDGDASFTHQGCLSWSPRLSASLTNALGTAVCSGATEMQNFQVVFKILMVEGAR